MGQIATLVALSAPLIPPAQNIPPLYAERMAGLVRRDLTGPFAIAGFGVFQTRLPPGGLSGLRHSHSIREEFIYVLEGEGVLVRSDGEFSLAAGMAAGFVAGEVHQLINRSDCDFVYLDITSSAPGDQVSFPDENLAFADAGVGGGRGFVPNTP